MVMDIIKHLEEENRLRKEMERLKDPFANLSKGMLSDVHDAISTTFPQKIDLEPSLSKMVCAVDSVNHLADTVARMQNTFSQMSNVQEIVANVTKMHDTWNERIRPLQPGSELLESKLRSILEISKMNLASVSPPVSLQEMELFKKNLHPGNFCESMLETQSQLELALGNVIELICSPDIFRNPVWLLPDASREVRLFNQVTQIVVYEDRLSNIISDDSYSELAHQLGDETIKMLKEVDPGLIQPLLGALKASKQRTFDRTRHFLVSLREFWGNLLRMLAPEKELLKWIDENAEPQLLHDNKPTRRAKIMYLCRNCKDDTITKFVEHDINSFIKYFDVFNRLHILNIDWDDRYIAVYFAKTLSFLFFILRIWDDSRKMDN